MESVALIVVVVLGNASDIVIIPPPPMVELIALVLARWWKYVIHRLVQVGPVGAVGVVVHCLVTVEYDSASGTARRNIVLDHNQWFKFATCIDAVENDFKYF